MTQTFYYSLYLIIYVFNLFVVRRFMNAFFEHKIRLLPFRIGTYSLYYMATSVLYLFVNIPVVTLIFNIAGLFLISLNYEATIRKRLFSILSIYLFLFLSEIVVVAISGIYHFKALETAEYIDLIWHFVIQLTTYLASVLVSAFKGIKKNKILSTAICATGIFIFGLSLYFILAILDSEQTTQFKALTSIIAVILLNIVVFFLYDKLSDAYQAQLDKTIAEKEKEYYFNQCNLMRTGIQELSEFRHDINNHLSVLANMIQGKHYNEAKGYVSELTEIVSTNTIICDTGNTIVDSIINYSFRNANEQNIAVNVIARIPENLNINMADISSILSNLLDNAITATMKLSDERFVEVKLSYSKERLFIFIKNTYDGFVAYENGKIITTKSDKKEHGIGISKVQEIAEHYDGCLSIEHDKKYFSSDVILYLSQSNA